MGKKRTRAKKTSKGLRPSVSAKHKVAATDTQKLFNRLDAMKKGKKVANLIPNPDTENLGKAPYIRVVS